MAADIDDLEAELLKTYEEKLRGIVSDNATKLAAKGMLRARINSLVEQGKTREDAVWALYEEAFTPGATVKPHSFFLFFDHKMLRELSGLHGFGEESVSEAFLAETRKQEIAASEIDREELTDLKLYLDQLFEKEKSRSRETSAELKEAAKYVTKIAILGPMGGTLQRTPDFADVIAGLSMDSCSVVLLRLTAGALHRTSIIGAFISPKTSPGREKIAQYFRSMTSQITASPISEENWKRIEDSRMRISQKALDIEGLKENMWENLV